MGVNDEHFHGNDDTTLRRRMKSVSERLRALGPGALHGIRRGIEKESLRVRPDGTLAATPHPAGLGSALTHPHVTTDFSEAQLELITGVHAGVESCLEELTAIHQARLPADRRRAAVGASMPCGLPRTTPFPSAATAAPTSAGRRPSTASASRTATAGACRPSPASTTTSLPDAPAAPGGGSNDEYFALIRNFRRHSWLLLYLFGASPAVCSSFVEGRAHELETLGPGTL